MSKFGVKVLFLMFFVLSLLLFLSVYFTSDALLGRVNCAVTWPSNPVVNNPSRLSMEEFAQEYITLSDKVEQLGPGKRLMDSFFHYFGSVKKTTVPARKNLLIAVITTHKYLRTRVQAIYETWVKDASPDVEIHFFVGEDCDVSKSDLKHLPIIKLHSIRDEVYPPQEKVFAVLKYLHSHYGERFKWFMRADDDVYIRVRELEKALQTPDWTEQLYIGHPGYGKKEDRRRLKLLSHENYCMGGPGVVFSAAGLDALYPHLDKCLMAVETYNLKWGRDIGWYNEDVELGRCVSRTLGINCSTTSKNKWQFFPDYKGEALNFSTLWSKDVFKNSITIHPVKQPANLFSIHHFYKTREQESLQESLEANAATLRTLCAKLPTNLLPKANNRTAMGCASPQGNG